MGSMEKGWGVWVVRLGDNQGREGLPFQEDERAKEGRNEKEVLQDPLGLSLAIQREPGRSLELLLLPCSKALLPSSGICSMSTQQLPQPFPQPQLSQDPHALFSLLLPHLLPSDLYTSTQAMGLPSPVELEDTSHMFTGYILLPHGHSQFAVPLSPFLG